jgi:D-alanine-D-alanine ligase-like ATP-grasp enzyme
VPEAKNMSEKAKLIKEMLEMQKKFMDYERKNGVTQEEYFTPTSGHVLDNYREKYAEMAMKVVDLAHADKGSHR